MDQAAVKIENEGFNVQKIAVAWPGEPSGDCRRGFLLLLSATSRP